MAVAITEQDKARARYHLDYLQVEAAQTFSLGIPAAIQTQFMIEGAMNRILPSALPKFLQLLDRLDCIECELFGGIDTASVTKVGEIEINRKRLRELGQYYSIARGALATLMGIVPNPFPSAGRAWWLEGGCNVSVV